MAYTLAAIVKFIARSDWNREWWKRKSAIAWERDRNRADKSNSGGLARGDDQRCYVLASPFHVGHYSSE